MNHLKQKPSFLSFLVGVLLVLLAILATLQYRWLGRVSAGERELMQANLRVKARSFCEEFDREITRAFASLKMNEATLSSENRSDYAERYDKWVKTAENPQIVKNVFLAEAGEGGQFHLLRFNAAAKAFEPIEWMPELENLRRRFERQQTSESKGRAIFNGGTDSIVEEIPALVNSIVSVKLAEAGTNLRQVDWQHPLGYVIITLDLDFIKEEFIPTLAKSYFASGETLDYDLTVVSRSEPKKVIYQSNPETEITENSSIDTSDRMLSISFDKVRSFSSERIYENDRSPNREKPGFTLVIPALKDGEAPANKVLLLNESASWDLLISHRAGSLDAAVANARWWNLLTSFGILLLLGGSMTMIVVLSRRAERLGRRQVEFVAGVSHEFRTPLAVIYSLSENLAVGRVNSAEQVKRYGATIHKDTRRLTEMIEQVLEFAGAERNKYFYSLHPVNINDVIENALAANHCFAYENDWIIEKDVEPDLPSVLADEAALERAIQNLINNAIKYGGNKKWIKIGAYKNAGVKGQEINITIEDRGSGIASNELPYIFEPFYRGQKVVDAQIHGSGLGLSLVKQIIEAHDGRISVESNLGEGSRLTLHLPALAQTAESENTLPEEFYERTSFDSRG